MTLLSDEHGLELDRNFSVFGRIKSGRLHRTEMMGSRAEARERVNTELQQLRSREKGASPEELKNIVDRKTELKKMRGLGVYYGEDRDPASPRRTRVPCSSIRNALPSLRPLPPPASPPLARLSPTGALLLPHAAAGAPKEESGFTMPDLSSLSLPGGFALPKEIDAELMAQSGGFGTVMGACTGPDHRHRHHRLHRHGRHAHPSVPPSPRLSALPHPQQAPAPASPSRSWARRVSPSSLLSPVSHLPLLPSPLASFTPRLSPSRPLSPRLGGDGHHGIHLHDPHRSGEAGLHDGARAGGGRGRPRACPRHAHGMPTACPPFPTLPHPSPPFPTLPHPSPPFPTLPHRCTGIRSRRRP